MQLMSQMSNVKCRVSNVECGMLNVECQLSKVKCQKSKIKCQMKNIKCEMSIRLNLLSKRSSRVSPVVFSFDRISLCFDAPLDLDRNPQKARLLFCFHSAQCHSVTRVLLNFFNITNAMQWKSGQLTQATHATNKQIINYMTEHTHIPRRPCSYVHKKDPL